MRRADIVAGQFYAVSRGGKDWMRWRTPRKVLVVDTEPWHYSYVYRPDLEPQSKYFVIADGSTVEASLDVHRGKGSYGGEKDCVLGQYLKDDDTLSKAFVVPLREVRGLWVDIDKQIKARDESREQARARRATRTTQNEVMWNDLKQRLLAQNLTEGNIYSEGAGFGRATSYDAPLWVRLSAPALNQLLEELENCVELLGDD